jgi:hypothetical protein
MRFAGSAVPADLWDSNFFHGVGRNAIICVYPAEAYPAEFEPLDMELRLPFASG